MIHKVKRASEYQALQRALHGYGWSSRYTTRYSRWERDCVLQLIVAERRIQMPDNRLNNSVGELLPVTKDYIDFFDAAKNFCAELKESIYRVEKTKPNNNTDKKYAIWDINRYQDLLGKPLRNENEQLNRLGKKPQYSKNKEIEFLKIISKRLNSVRNNVNQSLWRQALLNNMHGLYQVCEGIYQVRGYDLANMTIVETDNGIVVIDCTTAEETAIAALKLYREFRGENRPVQAIILTHTHVDHYGGIQGVLKQSLCKDETLPIIIAPEHFLEEAALENALVGDAMTRRSTYQYGTFLTVEKDGTGKVDAGLGKDIQAGGTVGFAIPDCVVIPNQMEKEVQLDEKNGYLYERMPYFNDGVEFEFLLCPNTEAPAEMTIWIKKYKTLVAAELATHTLHNLLTPRGAEVRDARLWWKALDKLLDCYGEDMECICATHHWPVWKKTYNQEKNEENPCRSFLEQQRDSYKFLHDQTIRLMNKGFTMLEIAAWFDQQDNLPNFMKNEWHNKGYYGTISHDVRAIYQKYIGWYDMNPSNLNPLPPEDTAKRYINIIGEENASNTIRRIQNDKNACSEDLRWAAELGKHLVLSGYGTREHQLEYHMCLAAIYQRLGFICEAGTWRNMYLVGAKELQKGGVIQRMSGGSANISILRAMNIELFYDFAASRLSADKAKNLKQPITVLLYEKPEIAAKNVKIANGVSDIGYCVTIENRVMNFHKNVNKENIESVVYISRTDFASLILGINSFHELMQNITIKGKNDIAEVFFSLFEKNDINFNIVLPK